MTIQEIISEADKINPNTIDEGTKIGWLNTIETTIYKELVLPRQGSELVKEPKITLDADYNQELIAEAPYDRLYVEYLLCKIDFTNREWDSYNNTASQFQQSYKEFAAYYNKNHMHKRTKMKNFL